MSVKTKRPSRAAEANRREIAQGNQAVVDAQSAIMRAMVVARKHGDSDTLGELRAAGRALQGVWIIVALLLSLLLPGMASAGPLRLPSAAFLTAQALDLTTTARALQAVPGAVEGNRLMGQSNAQRIAVKAVTSAGILGLSQVLAKRGHEKAAKVMLYGMSAAVGVVAVRNERLR